MSTLDKILSERGNRYGTFEGHAEISQDLKKKIKKYAKKRGCKLTPGQHESLEMIAHKIARILNGDPSYADSWVDIAGYAQVVAKDLSKKSQA